MKKMFKQQKNILMFVSALYREKEYGIQWLGDLERSWEWGDYY